MGLGLRLEVVGSKFGWDFCDREAEGDTGSGNVVVVELELDVACEFNDAGAVDPRIVLR